MKADLFMVVKTDYGQVVRWDRLFEELEASAADVDRADHDAEVADRTRRERARIQLTDRLLALQGEPGDGDMAGRHAADRHTADRATVDRGTVELRVLGAGTVRGRVHRVGGHWVLLATGGDATEVRAEVVVPVASIMAVVGMSRRAVTRPSGSVASRLGLGHVLRGMSRDRSTVRVTTIDGHQVTGTVDGVGADHIDVVPRDEVGPRAAVVVPMRAIGTLSRPL